MKTPQEKQEYLSKRKQKLVTIKLFYNKAINLNYIQIGEFLYGIKNNVAHVIAEKEELEIRIGSDIKEIKIMSLNDEIKK